MIFTGIVYLDLDMVLDIHEDQLAAFGGRSGLRDKMDSWSPTASPSMKWSLLKNLH